MKHRLKPTLLGVTLATALAGAAPALAVAGTTLTVRVEGKNRTLLAPTKITTRSGWLTRNGAPKGACSAGSAAGALNVATRGSWGGKFEQSFGDYFITKILGDFEGGKAYFWDIFVNNVSASTGACGVKLHRGDQLLFAAVPASGIAYPLGLSGPAQARVGGSATVKVVSFDAKGKAKPLAGARVTGAGAGARSNRQGLVHVHISHSGWLVLRASDHGFVRSAPLRIDQLP